MRTSGMRDDIGKTENEFRVKTKCATELLRRRLIEHHDYSVVKMAAPKAKALPVLCYPVIPDLKVTDEQAKRLAIRDIQEAVARSYNTTLDELISERKHAQIVRPRQVAMFLAMKRTPLGTKTIGRLFGNRDHSTVIHAVNKIKELANFDASLASRIDEIDAELMA